MELELLAILFVVAAVAGCFDAIAGGGGLITVPALILAGLDPVSAIATNKLQASAATLSSTAAFARKGLIHWRSALPIAVVAGAAAVVGATSVTLMPRTVLEIAVPVLLVGIALYFALGRRMSDDDVKARMGRGAFVVTVVPLVGFYDGLFGPGAGSFYMIGFVAALGFGIMKATAHTKVANAASNLGGLAFFAMAGAVVWPAGLVMAVGAVLGAQAGALLALKLGARLIRPLLVVVCCLMAVRLLSDPENAARILLSQIVQ